MSHTPRIAYFGGEPLGAPVLKSLLTTKFKPALVVCNPDRPAGRKRVLTPPPVKVAAQTANLPVWQPETLKPDAPELAGSWDLFIVVAYNKILPKWLISLPQHQTINLHPSRLPKLRGASPIRSAILRDQPEAVGVSIIVLDQKMDHGPILAQQALQLDTWPVPGPMLDAALTALGSELLIATIPRYLAGLCTSRAQDHTRATYCGRLHKADAELAIDPHRLPTGSAARRALATIYAFAGIGDAWFTYAGVRYKVKEAHLEEECLVIDTVIPAGKTASKWSVIF